MLEQLRDLLQMIGFNLCKTIRSSPLGVSMCQMFDSMSFHYV